MSFVRPHGDIEWRGASPELLAEDEQRFLTLARYLPAEAELRRRVTSYLDSRRVGALEAAFGDPSEIAAEFARLVRAEGRTVDEGLLRDDLRSALAEQDNALRGERPIREQMIDAEVRYARQETLRFWVDTLLLSWDLLDEPDVGIPLGRDLLPSSDVVERYSELRDAVDESRCCLRDAVALSSDDLVWFLATFVANVEHALEQRPVELPDGLSVALIEGKPWLRSREGTMQRDDYGRFSLHRSATAP